MSNGQKYSVYFWIRLDSDQEFCRSLWPLTVTRIMSSMLFALHLSSLQHVNCHKSVCLAVKPISLRTFAVLLVLHILYISRYISILLYTWIWFNSLVTFLWQTITSKSYLNTQVRNSSVFLGPLNRCSDQRRTGCEWLTVGSNRAVVVDDVGSDSLCSIWLRYFCGFAGT